jgi:hypothetical protein
VILLDLKSHQQRGPVPVGDYAEIDGAEVHGVPSRYDEATSTCAILRKGPSGLLSAKAAAAADMRNSLLLTRSGTGLCAAAAN